MAYITKKPIPDNDPVAIPEMRSLIDGILETNKNKPGATMVVLNELQSKIGYISRPMQEYVAKSLRVPPSTVHGVVSFYSFFSTTPRGKHTIKFCKDDFFNTEQMVIFNEQKNLIMMTEQLLCKYLAGLWFL